MSKTSKQFKIRIQGEIACFTRPEFKAERMSYEVMTPSAARGVLEAVLWKPAIVWRIDEITIGAPINWISFRRNEVSEVARKSPIVADEVRAQRNTVALRDVDYVVSAHFEMTTKATGEDNIRKFEDMFDRRLEKGQHFHQPYLGCREFVARVSSVTTGFEPQEINMPLGLLFFDFIHHADKVPQAAFFEANIQNGKLHVPKLKDVLARIGATR
jgi:CRISPR-associated protein Cas5d